MKDRYYVIETWENLAEPYFVQFGEAEDRISTENLEEAIELAKDMQDGYILDMLEMKIIKPK